MPVDASYRMASRLGVNETVPVKITDHSRAQLMAGVLRREADAWGRLAGIYHLHAAPFLPRVQREVDAVNTIVFRIQALREAIYRAPVGVTVEVPLTVVNALEREAG